MNQQEKDILDKLIFPLSGGLDLVNAASKLEFNSILDIGFGNGGASAYLAMKNKQVTSLGYEINTYDYPKEIFEELNVTIVEELFGNFKSPNKFDAIWASHVLEHVTNPGLFLKKCNHLLNEDGWLFIMVPPYKSKVVGGHVTVGWNLGQLMYNLLLEGFDIKNGHFVKHGYNICAFVQKKNIEIPKLRMDEGDIELTKDFWPMDIEQGFEGDIDRVNWFEDFEVYDKEKNEFIKEEYTPTEKMEEPELIEHLRNEITKTREISHKRHELIEIKNLTINKKQEEIIKLKGEMEVLKEEIEDMNYDIDEIEELEEKVEHLTKELSKTREISAKRHEVIENKNEILNQKQEEINLLKEQSNKALNDLKEERIRNMNNHKEVEEMKEIIEKLNKELEKTREISIKRHEVIEAKNLILNQKQEEIKNLHQTIVLISKK